MPRKKSEEFYRLHSFTPRHDKGKYTAVCNFCERVLKNTALSRLSLHRQTCDERRRKSYHITDVEKDLEERHHFKIQEYTGEDDDGCDPEGKEIIVKIQQILDATNDGNANQTPQTPVRVKSEAFRSACPDQEAEQHMEFEISGTDFLEDSKEQQLEDSTNESTMFIEGRPRHNLAALKAEKMRAEIRHFQSKTKFLKTETENLKLERTLALLRIQKLRLEIDALRA